MFNQGTCVSSQRLCLCAQHRLKLNNWLPAPAIDQSGVACKYARQPGRHARAGQIRMAAEMPENPLHVEAQKREEEIPASPIRLPSRTDCMAGYLTIDCVEYSDAGSLPTLPRSST